MSSVDCCTTRFRQLICGSDRFRTLSPTYLRGAQQLRERRLALVVLSVVEQRLAAFRAVLGGADVVEMAASVGVHRSLAASKAELRRF